MNPALEGAKAVFEGFWQGIQPYIIPLAILIGITTITCILIVKYIWKK